MAQIGIQKILANKIIVSSATLAIAYRNVWYGYYDEVRKFINFVNNSLIKKFMPSSYKCITSYW